jgi:hypothetical protein
MLLTMKYVNVHILTAACRVREAENKQTGEKVAIKIFDKE